MIDNCEGSNVENRNNVSQVASLSHQTPPQSSNTFIKSTTWNRRLMPVIQLPNKPNLEIRMTMEEYFEKNFLEMKKLKANSDEKIVNMVK